VQAVTVAIDETWLNRRQPWHDGFVGRDEETGFPLWGDLLPTRTTWACGWVLGSVIRLGKRPRAVITDGLAGSAAAIAAGLPTAKHLAGRFHQQQGVGRWLRAHASHLSAEGVKGLKRKRKPVGQPCDPRTGRRRLTRLAAEDVGPQGDLPAWISQTRQRRGQLVPARRRNAFPRPTNSLERFFRAFQRFYSTRGGFPSVLSARRDLMLFVVV